MKQHPYSPKHIIHCEDTGETVSGDKYLSSKHWKQLRIEVYNYYNGICQRCGDPIPLSEADIHHRVYKRMGQEKLSDMVLNCSHCHACIHSSKKKNHQTNKDLQTLLQCLTTSEKEEAYRLLVTHFNLSDVDLDIEPKESTPMEEEIGSIEREIRLLQLKLRKIRRKQKKQKKSGKES